MDQSEINPFDQSLDNQKRGFEALRHDPERVNEK